LTGVERALRNKFDTTYLTEVIAQTLRLFSEGTKVATEIIVMGQGDVNISAVFH